MFSYYEAIEEIKERKTQAPESSHQKAAVGLRSVRRELFFFAVVTLSGHVIR